MRLEKLLEAAHISYQKGEYPEIRKITIDSRKVEPGDLFVCIRGRKEDGHQYIPEALQRGAVAVILDSRKYKERYETQTTIFYVPDTRKVLPVLAGTLMRDISYQILFPYAAFFVGMSFITMLFVRHGDSKAGVKTGLDAFEDMDD